MIQTISKEEGIPFNDQHFRWSSSSIKSHAWLTIFCYISSNLCYSCFHFIRCTRHKNKRFLQYFISESTICGFFHLLYIFFSFKITKMHYLIRYLDLRYLVILISAIRYHDFKRMDPFEISRLMVPNLQWSCNKSLHTKIGSNFSVELFHHF